MIPWAVGLGEHMPELLSLSAVLLKGSRLPSLGLSFPMPHLRSQLI
jgi:hypothetical protein